MSRMADAGPLDREGPSDPRRVAEGREAGCSGVAAWVRTVVISGEAIQSKVRVAAWADASCSWSRVCVNGCSGPRPAVMYSVSDPTPVNAATAIQHYGGGSSIGQVSCRLPKARLALVAGPPGPQGPSEPHHAADDKTRRKDAIRKNLERTIIRLAEAEHQLLSAASAASASRSRMARISAATSK